MIVRDEAPIIRRALDSALPHIQAWLVLDTGSTDGTPEIVHSVLDGVPGRLLAAAWEGFATARTRAYAEASLLGTDYVLLLDADQTVEVRDATALTRLTADAYNIEIRHGPISYPHPWLLKSNCGWSWAGTTHEYLVPQSGRIVAETGALLLVEHSDSHRRVTGAKAREDRELLEQAHRDDPDDARTVFYLGQLCSDEGNLVCALKWYRQRVRMGGWLEEVWNAQYRMGRIYEAQHSWEPAVAAYLAAFSLDATRAEPLYRLGRGYLSQQHFELAELFFARAVAIAKPTQRLFLEDAVYDFAARWGLSTAQRLLGKHTVAEEAENVVMGGDHTPAQVVADILTSRVTKAIGRLPG
ncbi:MAG TPA: glycosyltransferase [Ktedonobacterales bacterium]|nr:glycosyltransferase [Ktedonobacterales bacterium]